MSEAEEQDRGAMQAGFTGGGALRAPEPRAWKPFAFAGLAILVVIAVLLFLGRGRPSAEGPSDAAYFASISFSSIKMSTSSNLSGGKETYLDGVVTNNGGKTIEGMTVKLDFRDFNGAPAASDTLPLNLIRAREPYVDVQRIGANPIKPGQSRPFRLIFDTPPESWNGAYPKVEPVSVQTK